ncbi:unnamed protein product, partial [Allacma fusca]
KPRGAISLRIHWVPPISRERCTAGRSWKPSKIRCAECFCIVSRFSRCYPASGCDPVAQSATSNSATTTMKTSATNPVTTEVGDTSDNTAEPTENNTPNAVADPINVTSGSDSADSSATGDASTADTSDTDETTVASSPFKGGKIRRNHRRPKYHPL